MMEDISICQLCIFTYVGSCCTCWIQIVKDFLAERLGHGARLRRKHSPQGCIPEIECEEYLLLAWYKNPDIHFLFKIVKRLYHFHTIDLSSFGVEKLKLKCSPNEPSPTISPTKATNQRRSSSHWITYAWFLLYIKIHVSGFTQHSLAEIEGWGPREPTLRFGFWFPFVATSPGISLRPQTFPWASIPFQHLAKYFSKGAFSGSAVFATLLETKSLATAWQYRQKLFADETGAAAHAYSDFRNISTSALRCGIPARMSKSKDSMSPHYDLESIQWLGLLFWRRWVHLAYYWCRT